MYGKKFFFAWTVDQWYYMVPRVKICSLYFESTNDGSIENFAIVHLLTQFWVATDDLQNNLT